MLSAFGVDHNEVISKVGYGGPSKGTGLIGHAIKQAKKGKLRRLQETEAIARGAKAKYPPGSNLQHPHAPGLLSGRAKREAWKRGMSS